MNSTSIEEVGMFLEILSSNRTTSLHGELFYYIELIKIWVYTTNRGVRQGGPISPYLFIIGTKTFSRMIVKVEAQYLLHDNKISRNSLAISHLFYVDYVLLFSQEN